MDNIKKLVHKLIKKYNTRSPYKIAKYLDIEIIFFEFEDIRGSFKKILKRKYIFINSNLNEFEQKLVCAHELGHALLHTSNHYQFMLDNTSILRRSKLEDEANLFLKYLLFDKVDLNYYYDDYIETDTVLSIMEELKKLN